MKTFVFGDVHGKLDMLLGLLTTAGITDAIQDTADGFWGSSINTSEHRP